jgi:predicted nucleic acid-binding protein
MARADSFEVADSSWWAFQAAIDLAIDHGLQIWDALIMAVAAENRCRLLLSEDLQSGFIWRGVTVVNPFSESVSLLLENILQAG